MFSWVFVVSGFLVFVVHFRIALNCYYLLFEPQVSLILNNIVLEGW